MDELRNALFADFASAIDTWTRDGIESMSPSYRLWWARDQDRFKQFANLIRESQSTDQLADLVHHLLEGCVHSILAAIDGASKSAEIGRVHLVDPDGNALGEGLHELFADYLGGLEDRRRD